MHTYICFLLPVLLKSGLSKESVRKSGDRVQHSLLPVHPMLCAPPSLLLAFALVLSPASAAREPSHEKHSLLAVRTLRTKANSSWGGFGIEKDADDHVRAMCSSGIQQQALELATEQNFAHDAFEEFTPLRYKSQMVKGVNFFVMVRVGSDQCIVVRIYEPLPVEQQPAQLRAVNLNASCGEEIIYFE